jgi:hypothetical protein
MHATLPKYQDPPLFPNPHQPPNSLFEKPAQETASVHRGRGSRFASGVRQSHNTLGPDCQGPHFPRRRKRNAGRRIQGTGSGTSFPVSTKWWGTCLGRCRRRGWWILYLPCTLRPMIECFPLDSLDRPDGRGRTRMMVCAGGRQRAFLRATNSDDETSGDEMDGDLLECLGLVLC